MKLLNCNRISYMLVGVVIALTMSGGSAKADFTFGEPTVITTTFVTAPSVSTDGLTLYVDAPDDGSGGWGIWANTRETIHDDWPYETAIYSTPPNSSYSDGNPEISGDDLTLFFNSDRPGGYGGVDMWLTTRATTDDPWSEPVNLGPTINGPYKDGHPSLSSDGLMLFFCSDRPGGYGDRDIYLSTRVTVNDPWSEPENLGPIVNSSSWDSGPDISSDGLTLFFDSERPGGYGLQDIWVTRRASTDDLWSVPVNLGPVVNDSGYNYTSCISTDGSIFYWWSQIGRLRQVPIIPIVDFNGDGNIDTDDLLIMIDNWGTDESLCDIGPTPLGDGVVDIEDLTVFIKYWEKENFIEVDEDDDGSKVTLKQGQRLIVTLESNPSTGYQWEVVENQDSILEQEGEAEFKPSEPSDPPVVGAGGWEIFRFKAVSAGQETVQLVYRRSWETDVEPVNTFSIEVVVN